MFAEQVSTPIQVDDFENEAWQRCTPVTIAQLWSGDPAPVERHAEVRICWSSEGLHVRFVCNQHEPLVVSAEPRRDRKTLGLWDRDVCEIFVAPDPEQPECYFEFEAAPTGEWVDLGILITPDGRETDWEYKSGMKAAAHVSQSQVIIRMNIPWSDSIPKPNRGDRWLVNLFRCIGPEAPERYLAWRPTHAAEPAFHLPEAFGPLDFS
jgi:cellulose/xylan binding protein with CBM9 domain